MREMQYRAGFFMQIWMCTLKIGVGLGNLYIVFRQANTFNGWSLGHMLVLLGVFSAMQGFLNLIVVPSMNELQQRIQKGDVDFSIVKPVDTQVLESTQNIDPWFFIDILLSIGIIAFGFAQIGVQVGIASAAEFAVAMLATCTIVYSFWVGLGSLCFRFQNLFALMDMSANLLDTARWPISIYPAWMKILLTAFFPLVFATTVSAQSITGRSTIVSFVGLLAIAIAFFIGARLLWKSGMRAYSGASA